MKSGQYAYRDRRQRKRDFRKLWITRINAAARMNDISYSQLMHGLRLAGVEINRKMLADLAVNDEEAFTQVVDQAKAALNNQGSKAKQAKVCLAFFIVIFLNSSFINPFSFHIMYYRLY